MNDACKLCRGACCESIVLPLPPDPDHAAWLLKHGSGGPWPGTVALECRCRALVDGKCSVYDSRPQVCRDYQPGSDPCRAAVIARRLGKADRILALLERSDL